MNILAHRGFWVCAEEKNTIVAFERALELGFGIETDVRDFNGELVISHDVPLKPALFYRDFVDILNKYPKQIIAMNIKADGLQSFLADFDVEDCADIFYFDMSVPDTIGFNKSKLPFFTRFSDLESAPALLDEASGVWLDNFSSEKLDEEWLNRFLTLNKKVALVSPELHGFDYSSYWNSLKVILAKLNGVEKNLVSLCTDYPTKAREFFN